MRRRRLRLLVLLPLYAVGVALISWFCVVALFAEDWGELLRVVDTLDDPESWFSVSICAFGLVGLQAIILLPVLRFRLSRAEKGKPLLFSVILLSTFASALTLGLVLGLWELAIIMVHDRVDVGDEAGFAWIWWGTLTGSWLLWTFVFWRFTRRPRRPEGRIGRLIGLLVGGSIVEIALIVPIDVMVRRRTDCYCNTGTFFALGFSILACLWLAGPGAFIALTGKRRRAWYETHCETCGYERGPTPGERCPECGEVWPHERPTTP